MRARTVFILVFLLCTLLPAQLEALPAAGTEFSFHDPIDALSIGMTDVMTGQAVSTWNGRGWTPWQELALENEQDIALRESNLVMLPLGTLKIRFRAPVAHSDVHPIRVARALALFTVAAAGDMNHRILSRKEWGADESLLISASSNSSASSETPMEKTDNGTATSGVREQDCLDVHRQYTSEFTSSAPVTRNANGDRLRWPQEYSPSVRLLVVHHTAIAVAGDSRSGVERMRALYQFHTENRGWGDIGYHYVIDEAGQIYEGRSGGDFVVGGHVYCNNVGTVGVALMGNFDKEQPTQEQAKSLQWLLRLLAEKYEINTARDVMFHGKTLPTIVGHRQLVSTDCPGLTMWSALEQVREHVREANTNAGVVFPEIQTTKVAGAGEPSKGAILTGKDGLATLGETVLEGRPGGEVIFPVFFHAEKKSYVHNTRIARVTRSRGLEIWQERDGVFALVRGDIKIPVPLVKKGQSIVLKVKVRLPMERGEAALKIGSLNYTFEMSGRAARTRQLINTGNGAARLPVEAPQRVDPGTTQQSRISSSAISSSASAERSIRIRLTPELPMNGLICDGTSVKTDTTHGLVQVEGYFRSPRNYRGRIECQEIDGELVLINALPLEDYLMGLAEEPDTEPFEKQRAFAIAARTYARYYTDPLHRKFPGKPYDGDDSGARFQVYRGQNFEEPNPEWLRAVQGTAGKVLTYHGEVIRAPYFSTDDGRTRTPEEAGWKDFPFPEIFTSKEDSWCSGLKLSGHGVGMSGCGAGAQAQQGKIAEQILEYYYPGTRIESLRE